MLDEHVDDALQRNHSAATQIADELSDHNSWFVSRRVHMVRVVVCAHLQGLCPTHWDLKDIFSKRHVETTANKA